MMTQGSKKGKALDSCKLLRHVLRIGYAQEANLFDASLLPVPEKASHCMPVENRLSRIDRLTRDVISRYEKEGSARDFAFCVLVSYNNELEQSKRRCCFLFFEEEVSHVNSTSIIVFDGSHRYSVWPSSHKYNENIIKYARTATSNEDTRLK